MMDLTNGLPPQQSNEGFTFNGKHTSEYGMLLVERLAPTPVEKKVYEDIPYMQGVHDFSSILGGRVYDNRPITFVFEILNKKYNDRKTIQTSLENWLMNSTFSNLYDDHAEGYYYVAKCESIETLDSFGGLTVNINFEAYPFKIGEYLEGNDIWDIFNFELDYAQVTEFTINGTKNIKLYNGGAIAISPKIISSSNFEVELNGVTFHISSGMTESRKFMLKTGENNLIISGNGTIEFQFRKELI